MKKKEEIKPEEEKVDSNLEAVQEELEEDTEDNSNEGKFTVLYKEKVEALEDLNNRFLRLQADFSNYKRRVEKDKETIYTYANQELVSQLLLVVDNLERALLSNDEEKGSPFYTGIEMVNNQLMDILKKNGLEVIEALGEKFNPNLHHGVAQEPSEEYDEDTVIEVFQKGYKIKDKVIRPSMVKIAK